MAVIEKSMVKVGERLTEKEHLLALVAEDASESAYSLERSFEGHNRGFRRAFVLLAAMVLVFAGTNYALRLREHTFSPKQITSINFSGTCQPAGEVRVSSEELGTVAEILVQPGDVVEKGQILMQMADESGLAALREAELQRSIARQNLSDLHGRYAAAKMKLAVAQSEAQMLPARQFRDSPERARTAYKQAESNYERAAALVRLGVLAQQELDNREVEMRLAKDDLDNAEHLASASAELASNQREQAMAESEMAREVLVEEFRRADLNFQDCRRKLANTVIRAQERAVVAEVTAHVGDRLPGGVLLARLAQLHTMVVEVPVAAQMIGQLHLQQTASVQLPTMPMREVEGIVRVINPLPAANMTHTVKVEFNNESLDLLAGQPAKVRFLEAESR